MQSGQFFNYEYLDSPALRTKPEYFSPEKALTVSEDNLLYLIDLSNFSSDFILDLKKPVFITPHFIEEDKILIQYIDNTFDYYDLQQKKTLWHRTMPDLTKNYSLGYYHPLVHNGVIYCSMPGGMLTALAQDSGKTLWNYNASSPSASIYHDGRDFLSPTAMYLTEDGQSIALSYTDNTFHLISAQTGLPQYLEVLGSYNKVLYADKKFIALVDNNLLIAFEENPNNPSWKLNLDNHSLLEAEIIGSSLYLLFKNELWVVDLHGTIDARYRHTLINPHLISNFEKDRIFISDQNNFIYNLLP
jgi:outer membrane protein assembly factor BamB